MEKQEISKEVQKIEPSQLTMQDVHKYICPEATEKEVFMFLQIAKSCNLNPFLSQIYLIKYGNQKAQILTSYNVYLQRAERTGKYAGLETTTVGSVEKGDLKAIIKVFRKDWDKPLIHEVYFEEYAQRKADGTLNRFWKEKPRTMIVKVGISQAFRLAFPLDFEGMPYTQDEMPELEINGKVEKEEKPRKFSPPQETLATPSCNAPKSSGIAPPLKDIPVNEPLPSHTPNLSEIFDEIIAKAIQNGYKPLEIEERFNCLNYHFNGKLTKKSKITELMEEPNEDDLVTILDEVLQPKGK